MRGKGTTDAMFALRMLMEKYREGQRELHCVLVDLEKAYDRVPKEELWYCMRNSGTAEKYVRLVQNMHKGSETAVRCVVEVTESFKVKEFKYLESTVKEKGNFEREVKGRVQAEWNRWRKVSGIICDRRLPARVKEKVYSLWVRPAVVYGLETRAATKKQVEEMEAAEMKMLRFALGSTRKNKTRNKYIRSTVKVEWL